MARDGEEKAGLWAHRGVGRTESDPLQRCLKGTLRSLDSLKEGR